MEWLMSNWDVCLAGFFLAEKIVKLTPTKYDDILIDMIGRTLIGKRKP